MKRRAFLGGTLAGGALASSGRAADLCGCSLFAQAAAARRGCGVAAGRIRRKDHRHEGVRRRRSRPIPTGRMCSSSSRPTRASSAGVKERSKEKPLQ